MQVSYIHALILVTAASSALLALFAWGAFVLICPSGSEIQASEKKQLWTVHNKRYDLSDWVNKHPGGQVMIMLGRGRNCTELFESYHSLSTPGHVDRILSKFYVEDANPGDLDYDDSFDWVHTPFYDALRARVLNYFRQRKISHKAGFAQRLQLGAFVVATMVAYYYYVRGSWVAAILLPLFYWLGPSGCMHDGAHSSVLENGNMNNLLAYFGSAHMSILSWNQQHTIGHHTHTNMVDRDPDLYHFSFNARDGIPGFRTSTGLLPMPDNMGMFSRAMYWRLGLAIRSFLTTLGPSYIWDTISLTTFSQSYLGIVPYTTMTPSRLFIHIAGRILVAWLCFTCPLINMTIQAGIVKGLVFAMTPYLVHGFVFYIFSQVSHVQAVCFPSSSSQHVTGEGKKEEWAVHQVKHTLDYAMTSRLWLHISGGLNNQVCHHLFPQVGWDHHDQISPIVEQTCKEFGVHYNKLSTFWNALAAHVSYLYRINESTAFDEPPSRYLSVSHLKLLGEKL